VIHARMDYNDVVALDKKIPADEPVFLIRGQDAVGAHIVRQWADAFESAGGDPKLAESARAHALLMDAWPKKKLADVPDGTPIATATQIRVEDADSSGNGVEEA